MTSTEQSLEKPCGLPMHEVPVRQYQYNGDQVTIALTQQDPFEVHFKVPQDRIAISLDHPTDSIVACDGGRSMHIHGLPNALHYHPAGSCIYANKRDAKSSFAIVSYSRQFRDRLANDAHEAAATGDTVFNIPARTVPLVGQMLRHFCLNAHQGGQLLAESLVTMAATEVMKTVVHRQAVEASFEPDKKVSALERAKDYIEIHLSDDISLSTLAQTAAMSICHFSRSFKDYTTKSPHAFVMERRINRAQNLLANSNERIITIALDCGFSSHSHLTTSFKQLCGMTPAAYRREAKK